MKNLLPSNFLEMNLVEPLNSALQKMKISKPTLIQKQAIPAALNKMDVVALAETGSGKTLAFLLPTLNKLSTNDANRALIVAPSREMAQQIFNVLKELNHELNFTLALLIGGVPSEKQLSALKKNPRIIVGTPGRINDHLHKNKLLLTSIETIVIDEADRMLDMGFLPQLKNIRNVLTGQIQTLMFSASLNTNLQELTKIFVNPKAIFIKTEQAEAPVESLKQRVLYIDKYKRNDRLLDELNLINNTDRDSSVIIFCSNQGNCERLGQYLKDYGFRVDLIHGGLSQGQRNRVVRNFRENKINIIVATDLLARGLDVPQVDHVINFELPQQGEDFLHRIGRTARAGRGGAALTFITSADFRTYQKIKGYLRGAQEVKLEANFQFEKTESKFSDNEKFVSEKKKFKKTKTNPKGKATRLTISNLNSKVSNKSSSSKPKSNVSSRDSVKPYRRS